MGLGDGTWDMGPRYEYKDGQCSGSTVAVDNVSRERGKTVPLLTCMRRDAGWGKLGKKSTPVLDPSSSHSAVAGFFIGLFFSHLT